MPCTNTPTISILIKCSFELWDTRKIVIVTQAKKAARGRAIGRELEEQGIYVRSAGRATLMEEIPEAYKDVREVVDVVHGAGISKKVAQLRPLGVIKG
jgi:tRNA-splicing ligase RtcB